MVLSDSELQDLSDTGKFSEKDTIWQEFKDGREFVKVSSLGGSETFGGFIHQMDC